MPPRSRIEVEGMAELRRALRRVEPDMRKELDRELRSIGRYVLMDARMLAPKDTGRLARSLRVSVSRGELRIQSRLEYAPVIHWGGSTGRGHRRGVRGSGNVKLERKPFSGPTFGAYQAYKPFITQAADRNNVRIRTDLTKALGRVARHFNTG